MKRWMICLGVLFICASTVFGQTPSTQPTLVYVPRQVSRGGGNLYGGNPPFLLPDVPVRLKLAPGAPMPTNDELAYAISLLSWRPWQDKLFRAELRWVGPMESDEKQTVGAVIGISFRENAHNVFESAWKEVNPDFRNDDLFERGFRELIVPSLKQLNMDTVTALSALARSEPPMSTEARAKRVAEISQTLIGLQAKLSVIDALKRKEGDPWARVNEKLQAIRAKSQELESQRSAQQARQVAVTRALNELQNQSENQRQKDPILQELQKIYDLQEQQIKRAQMAGAAHSPAEIAALEAQLAEAKIRLLERQATLGKAGKGELMDRLTDELTMVSIQTTDLEIQIAQLRDQINATDPAKQDAKGLAALIESDPLLDPRLYDKIQEISNQVANLWIEWFKLVVDDVTPLPSQAQAAEPAK